MIFNGDMSIWILALVVLILTALAGWRLGAIRAAISFVGILFAALLAGAAGKLCYPILSHLGVKNPLLLWGLSPICGFILVSALFKIAGQPIHGKVEQFYKYKAGDLRLALWERMNSRLGICVGLLNGALYFVLICFVIFNMAYLTTQVSVAPEQPLAIRTINTLGNDLEATHLARMATAVGTLSPAYYQLSDLAGFLMQQRDPKIGSRLVEYPALTSLWERDDFKPLVQDGTVTNALASGASVGELFKDPTVRDFLENKDQTSLLTGILLTNMDDLMAYLQTGKSAKYDGEKLIGRWEFNPTVTLAWMRQNQPKMPASQMRLLRVILGQAYAQTRVLVSGDNQLFVKGLPRFKANPGQFPTIEREDWKGDWSANGTNYDLHITFNGGEDKFFTATAEDFRLSVKDGRNLLIFDRVD
jgi:hypothetical protein